MEKNPMTSITPFEQLEQQLKAMIPKNNSSFVLDTDPLAAYQKGISDALELVHQFKKQYGPAGNGSETTSPVTLNDDPKLYQCSPERVAQIDLADPDIRKNENITDADLTEAAFHFENQLLELLEDANTIPYDAYEGLDPVKLAGIIQNSVEKICQLQNG